nr:L-fucose isomerase [bacterium]
MFQASDFPLLPGVNRLRGSRPKVGIRPVIDGRQGGLNIRASLEGQTMGMALAAKQLIESTVRHPDGTPVECVIADTTIGGVAEAAACAEKFAREGVGVSLTVTPCWCYGSETMDMDPYTPKAIWGLNATERPGAVYLAAVMAAHNQKGLPAFGIYGRDVQDADDPNIPGDVREKIIRFVRAGLAVAWMRGKSYLGIGNFSMGIAGAMVDADWLERYLGMRYESVESVEFLRRVELGIFDPDEFARAMAFVDKVHVGPDNNPEHMRASDKRKAEDWVMSVKMALIGRDLMVGNPKLAEMGFAEEALGHNAIAAGFQGQRQWTDHYTNGDFMEAMLNTSFDWNGIRQPYIMATENDHLNAISMLFGHLLTGGAQVFADVRTYWSPEAVKRVTGYTLPDVARGGMIHLINSGAAALDAAGCQRQDGVPAIKPWWQVTGQEAADCINATSFRYASLGYFRGGGYSSDLDTQGGMPVTMVRINRVRGLGPVMQLAEGYTVGLPKNVHDTLDERTDPTWPTTWFAPRLTGKGAFTDGYTVMSNWGANHGTLCGGHVGAELITLASMLRIPVNMHNLTREQLFRPGAWTAFGTQDLEGADFRACQAFGPLYGK